MRALVLLFLPVLAIAQASDEAALRKAFGAVTGAVRLPAGRFEISREIVLPEGAHDLTFVGDGTTIRAASSFKGRGLIVGAKVRNIKLDGFILDGNRDAFPQPIDAMQTSDSAARVFSNNGILIEGADGLEITGVRITAIPGFPILASGGTGIRIHDVEITDSGSLDLNGRNNGSGGILIENGATGVDIHKALIGKVRGNGIWIRSATTGSIANNDFHGAARAAIELNRASGFVVSGNTIHMAGFPGTEAVAFGTVMPAAIETSGAVDHTFIRDNRIEQVAGRCFTLDGFSSGEVTNNECVNILFNGILLRGSGNKITGNRMSSLNQGERDQPDSIRTGIYLPTGTSNNTVDANQISGHGMAKNCVGGPGAAGNMIGRNLCSDGPSMARLLAPTSPLPSTPHSQSSATASYPNRR